MRPAHQLASAQHQLAGRDVGAPDPLLNSAAVERRLRRAVQWGKITGGGHILGRSGDFSPILLIPIDAGKKISIIASVHVGCFELLAIERIRSIADLKGKTVGPDLGTSSHVFVSTMAAHVGLDPAKDINWVRSPSISPMELFADGKIDAWLGFPPDVGPVAFVCTENLIRIDCVTESGLILKRVVKRHLLGARIRENAAKTRGEGVVRTIIGPESEDTAGAQMCGKPGEPLLAIKSGVLRSGPRGTSPSACHSITASSASTTRSEATFWCSNTALAV
jgi:hypothetical protein